MINYYEKAGQGMALGHIRRAFLNILRNCKAGKILVELNKVGLALESFHICKSLVIDVMVVIRKHGMHDQT